MTAESMHQAILIVEDEALIAMHEQAILKRHGYTALYVTSGDAAIEYVRTTPEVGLVLMDIDLGSGIDGTIAAEAILKIRELPVVFLSSHTEPEVVEKTERNTSYGYIVKNSGETVLLASVKMAFRLFEARSESKRQAALLQKSEDRFRALFENAPLGYQSLDADGRFLQVNDAWLKTFGYERDEVLGRSFGDFLLAGNSDEFITRFARFKQRGHIQTAFEMLQKNGERRYITFAGRIGTDEEGHFKQTHCILRDETERKRTVEALESSEAFQRKMVANIQDVIVIIDRNGIVRYKSPNIERLFGWSPGEIVGDTAWNNVHPDDRDSVVELFRSLSATAGTTTSLKCRYRHKDGEFRWIEFTGTNMFDDPEIAGIIGNYHDVTEQRRWEQKVESSVYELNKSQEVANVGNWIWHIPENSLEWSDQMYRIFGIDQEHFVGDLAQVLAMSIHPDDREAVEASNSSVIERKAPIPLEYRVIRPDGSIRTVWAEAGELELGDDGNPVLLRGIVLDITERKRAEDHLREHSHIFSKSEELTRSGGWKWDIAQDRFTFTDGWMRVHGADRSSMNRSDLLSLAHPTDRAAVESAFKAALEGKAPYQIEHRILRCDNGEERTVRALGEVVYDSGGVPTQMLGAAQDITEEKRREGSLKVRQDAINALLREKDLVLKETHHRIKNNFAIIESLLNLQADAASHPEASASLRSAGSRVANMRALYDRLLLTDRHQSIPVRPYFLELTKGLLMAYVDSDRIDLRCRIDEFELDSQALFPLGTIVAELLTNCLKHAYTPEEAGLIELTLVGQTDAWALTVRDHGRGHPESHGADTPVSFGLMLVRMLSEQLHADFTTIPAEGGGTVCAVTCT